MLTATPRKLQNGNWGAMIQAVDIVVGERIEVRAKSGRCWTDTVSSIVWTGQGKTIVATKSAPPNAAPSSATCDECGTGRGYIPRCDSSGINGRVCGRCNSMSREQLSFA